MSPRLVVSYGGGINSTAMLVGLAERGIIPDAILFADTGGEHPHTYEYIQVITAFCLKNGFPPVTVLKYVPRRAGPIAWTTLEQECVARGHLPRDDQAHRLSRPHPAHWLHLQKSGLSQRRRHNARRKGVGKT